jgi:hypothetical protein
MAGIPIRAHAMSGERQPDPARVRALETMHAALDAARASISRELCAIPPPVPACDVNFNRLLEDRARIADALQALARLRAESAQRAALLAFCREASGLDTACRSTVEAILAGGRPAAECSRASKPNAGSETPGRGGGAERR